jgi:hypothetical protein
MMRRQRGEHASSSRTDTYRYKYTNIPYGYAVNQQERSNGKPKQKIFQSVWKPEEWPNTGNTDRGISVGR